MLEQQLDKLANKHNWTKQDAIKFAQLLKCKFGREYDVRHGHFGSENYQVFNVEEELKPWHGKVVYTTCFTA